MANPRLTIVTVTKDNPQDLEQTILSLRALKDFPELTWEHLIVDSSSNRVQVPKDWSAKILWQEPQGIYAAMNTGWQKAQGEWIWFLNAGDALKTVDVLTEALEKGRFAGAELVVCGADLQRGGEVKSVALPDARGLLGNLLGENKLCHQAVLFSKKILTEFSGFDAQYRLAADYDFFWRAWKSEKNAIVLKKALAVYALGGTSDKNSEVLREFAVVQAKHLTDESWLLKAQNELGLRAAIVRIAAMKLVGKSKLLSSVLKPMWDWVKR